MQSYLSRGLGERYSPQVHSHRQANSSLRDTTHRHLVSEVTSPCVDSSRSVSPCMCNQKFPRTSVLKETCVLRVSTTNSESNPQHHLQRPSTQETHLQTQLLPFTANEHLNTAPLCVMPVLTVTISSLRPNPISTPYPFPLPLALVLKG